MLDTIKFKIFYLPVSSVKTLKIKIHETIILPVVLYGSETWSLAPSEEHSLRVFGGTVLRRLFGLQSEEVAGGWRRLHNEELHGLYTSLNIIRVIKLRMMRWECSMHEG
jgi:hypothetical protein